MSEIRSGAASSTPDDSRRPRRIRFWHVGVILLLVPAATLVGLRWHWRGQLRRRIEKLATAGYPVTVEQLDAWYRPLESDQENMADVISAAASHIALDLSDEERELVPFVGQGELPPPGKPLSAEMRAALTRLIDDHHKALDYLQHKPLAPNCRYPLDWSDGLKGDLPRLSEARECVSLLCLAAVQAFDETDLERAIGSLVRALAIGRSIGEVPLTWIRHSSCRCRDRTVEVLEWGLSRHPLTDDQLAQVVEALGEDDCSDGIVRALAGMRCLVLPILEHPVDPYNEDLPPAPVVDLYRASGLAAREAVIYADMIETYIQVAQLPLSQWQSAAKAADDRIRTRVGWCLQLYYLSREETGLSFHLVHSLVSRARLDTARTALAVERYRLAKGRLPEMLTDLVPQYLDSVPLDPFDGAAMRYQTLATGFVVYSVGLNGWDDGGLGPASDRRGMGGNGDITFTVER